MFFLGVLVGFALAGAVLTTRRRRIIEQPPPHPPSSPIHIIVRSEVDEGVIVRSVLKDYKSNGPIRQMLKG